MRAYHSGERCLETFLQHQAFELQAHLESFAHISQLAIIQGCLPVCNLFVSSGSVVLAGTASRKSERSNYDNGNDHTKPTRNSS